MNEVLISGYTGFVGLNLAKYLQDLNYNVCGLSRDKTRVLSSIQKVLLWNEFEIIKQSKFTAFIHLAGKAHDLKNISKDAEYYEINTGLTIKLFDLFLQSAARDFIYFSSVKAVADSADNILTEDVVPNPLTAYGKSKLKAEEYLLSKKIPPEKRLIILRPCMIHGPNNKGNLNLLYQFVKKGIPYPLAAFKNKRSFLSIDNLCFIIQQLLDHSSVASGVYNVADDESLSTNKVVETISYVLNKKLRLWKISKTTLKNLAIAGDKLRLPFNSERLKKLTEDYVVSNNKIKNALKIKSLPLTAEQGLIKTIQSFSSV